MILANMPRHFQQDIAKEALTEKEYAVWELRDLKGLSLRQCCYHLDLSMSTIRETQARAERKLKNYIATAKPSDDDYKPIPARRSTRDAGARYMIKSLLAQRDGTRCYLCRQDFSLRLLIPEHIIPKSRGGTDDAWNLALGCTPCNVRKGNRLVSLDVTSGGPVYHAG